MILNPNESFIHNGTEIHAYEVIVFSYGEKVEKAVTWDSESKCITKACTGVDGEPILNKNKDGIEVIDIYPKSAELRHKETNELLDGW